MFCDKNYVNSQDYKEFWNNLANGISQLDEFERFRKDGSSIWLQVHIPCKNENGKVTSVVKFVKILLNLKSYRCS